MRNLAAAVLAAALLLAPAALPGQASPQQPGWDPARVQLTRADLQGLLASYEQAAASPAHSGRYRAQARTQAEAIRARLRDGDVQAGDQVALLVEGQQALTDTFTVRAGGLLFLPQIGDVPLQGLLRSEIEGKLLEHLSKYVRNPVVRARPLVRIAVEGEVRSPGYYVVPADAPLSDVLMMAGGPAAGASTARLRVERGDRPVWQGDALREALAHGRTLDAMGVHAGDRLFLAPKPSNAAGVLLRTVPVAVSVALAATRL